VKIAGSRLVSEAAGKPGRNAQGGGCRGRRACRLERAHGPDQQEAVAMRAFVLAHEAGRHQEGLEHRSRPC
jgi:hypothetical protein